jgi:hypothetical protein
MALFPAASVSASPATGTPQERSTRAIGGSRSDTFTVDARRVAAEDRCVGLRRSWEFGRAAAPGGALLAVLAVVARPRVLRSPRRPNPFLTRGAARHNPADGAERQARLSIPPPAGACTSHGLSAPVTTRTGRGRRTLPGSSPPVVVDRGIVDRRRTGQVSAPLYAEEAS